MKPICNVLKTKKNIQFLKLGDNLIGDDGAKFLAREIKSGNMTVKKIWLDRNMITGEGVKALAEVLEVNNHIELLHLGANHIGTGTSWLCWLKKCWIR